MAPVMLDHLMPNTDDGTSARRTVGLFSLFKLNTTAYVCRVKQLEELVHRGAYADA